MSFLDLKNRYLLQGTLELSAPLHVGSGFEDTETGSDAGFISDAGGSFVPGSSLRGVVRSTVERIMQSLGQPKRGCVLFEEESHPTCPTANEDRRTALEAERDETKLMEQLLGEEGLCDVCRLFGSPLLASKLRISDARPVNGQVRLNKRDGVGIDRDTETAREKIKFDFMAMEPYAANGGTAPLKLSLEVQVENADANDLALLGIVMRELTQTGIDVGGKKARGFGRVKLKRDYRVDYFDDAASLRNFLTTGELKHMNADQFDTLLNSRITAYFDIYYGEAAHAQAGGE